MNRRARKPQGHPARIAAARAAAADSARLRAAGLPADAEEDVTESLQVLQDLGLIECSTCPDGKLRVQLLELTDDHRARIAEGQSLLAGALPFPPA